MQNVALNLPKSGQNARKQPKTTKEQLKIAKIWPRYNSNHQNYSPIRGPGQNQSWIRENISKKTDQMAKKCLKTATKVGKIGLKSQKMTKNHIETP